MIPNHKYSQGALFVDCNEISTLPVISFKIGGYWFEMLPSDYIVYYDSRTCFACIFENDSNEYWILGDAFLRGYYSVHDYEN